MGILITNEVVSDSQCQGDAEGLRALRRVMVCYFLADKPERQDSKYASFTLIDLVVEMAESERTRRRMDLYVTVNPSGTVGGGLFRDKFEVLIISSPTTDLNKIEQWLAKNQM